MNIAALPTSLRQQEQLGLLLGLIGVIAFSLTLPMTRVAVAQMDPWVVAFGRMALAGLISAAWLWLSRAPLPTRSDLPLLLWQVLGIVIGFPLLTSLAMRLVPANHGAIIIGSLPFATAVLAAIVLREQQTRRFWICAAIGSLLVIAFALRESYGGEGVTGGKGGFSAGDLLLLAAVLASAIGYVAGTRLAARMGGVNAIMWALVLALPVTLPISATLAWQHPPRADLLAWGAFAYITLISQVAGFFAWYKGLVIGGIARVGQVQLLQVFFTIGFAALLFGERVEPATWLFAAAVVLMIAIGRSRRTKV